MSICEVHKIVKRIGLMANVECGDSRMQRFRLHVCDVWMCDFASVLDGENESFRCHFPGLCSEVDRIDLSFFSMNFLYKLSL